MASPATGRAAFRHRKIPRGGPYLRPVSVVRALTEIRKGMDSQERTAEFEGRFAATFGAHTAVALPFARVALFALLEALDLPEGSEVITTPVTISDMTNMILLAGHRPVFVDLAPHTGNMDPDRFAEAITPRTRVVLVTHLNGIPADMEAITAIARKRGIVVLEDGSQSIGARYGDRPVGLLGDAGFFSISTLKPISTFNGGMVITDDQALGQRIRTFADGLPNRSFPSLLFPALKELGMTTLLNRRVFSRLLFPLVRTMDRTFPDMLDRLQHLNFDRDDNPKVARRDRMPRKLLVGFSDFQAAVGLQGFHWFDKETRRRNALGQLLHRELETGSVPGLLRLPEGIWPVFWRFPCWVEDPAAFKAFLMDRYVDTTVSGLACCSREPGFEDLHRDTPEAFRFMDRMIFLPIHSGMSEDQVRYVAQVVREYHG